MIGCFTKNSTISSALIRTATWSPWSHTIIVLTDSLDNISIGTPIIDSTFLHGGVKLRTLGEALRDANKWAFLEVPTPDDAAGIAFAHAQVGKPYDTTALTGMVVRRNWADDDRWFCNELWEATLAAAGLQRFREDLARLTPRHSWMLNTPTPARFGSTTEGLWRAP